VKLLEIISAGFNVTNQLLIAIFCIRRTLEKIWEYNEEIHQLFTDFEKAYDSGRKASIKVSVFKEKHETCN
jgi:hypothetical protein